MSEGVISINKKLKDDYGRDVASDLPNYRIVWSTTQTEKRYGTFEDWLGDIWLREVTETREVPKYPLYEDMWVLEHLQGIDLVNSSIRGSNYSYEPLWVFGANNSERQPTWRAVEFMLKAHRYVEGRSKLPSDLQAEQDAKFLAEKAKFKEMLQDNSPAIPAALHHGEAIAVPSNYERQK